ncbi:MAG TPA: hypothetical protein VI643_02495, partial [Planctomycetota bacterium]|nr:hypothetical protein [Planctomycetota bacterium]
PEKLTQDALAKYTIDQDKNLLAYRTTEGYPRVFIRNRYSAPQGTAQSDEGRLNMLIIPYQRRASGDRIDRLADWPSRPFAIGQDRLDEALRSSFELIVFLASKQLIKVPEDAQQTIWRNILDEYSQFLALHAPACRVREPLDGLRTSAGALTVSQVKELLDVRCKELPQDPDPATKKNYMTAALPYFRDSAE